jgi:hypothetical protein
MDGSKPDFPYSVLSPWAEVDPVPLKGIAPRLDNLSGKKIGLFCNFKPAARPVLTAVEERLRERYPDCEIIWYIDPVTNVAQLTGANKTKFDDWLNNIDAAVLAVGD